MANDVSRLILIRETAIITFLTNSELHGGGGKHIFIYYRIVLCSRGQDRIVLAQNKCRCLSEDINEHSAYPNQVLLIKAYGKVMEASEKVMKA